MRLNFNYASAVTHTAYLVNQREITRSLLRLSTGMRILDASDDAAGLFIADQLSTVAAGLEESNRNISTAISALRIAENAAGQIYDKLKDIYSRAVSAANDINDPNARTALQEEVSNLVDAIQKIGTDTEYNGIKLLDGTFNSKYIHYGARMDQVVNVSIDDLRAQSLGAYIVKGDGGVYTSSQAANDGNNLQALLGQNGALGGQDASNFRLDTTTDQNKNTIPDYVAINGIKVYEYNGSSAELVDAKKLADKINNNSALKALGIEAKASNTSTANTYDKPVTMDTGVTSVTVNLNFYIGDGSQKFTISNFVNVDTTTGTSTFMTLDELVSQINSQAAANGVPITAMNDNGKLKLVTTNGETIAIEAQVTASGTGKVHIDLGQLLQGAGTVDVSASSNQAQYVAAVKVGSITIAANQDFKFEYSGVSDNKDSTNKGLNFELASGSNANFFNLNSINLTTNNGAEDAMLIVSKALQKVDTVRTQIGATMNNLQSIFDAQNVAYDNTKEAENVIRNTDYAEEMSNFTALQVKMQSTMAMLAQANALPQMVLQLLR
ncbi:MAG: flagellin [Thermocrinis sp.]|nr:flagellin [Thermocrinis sp.]